MKKFALSYILLFFIIHLFGQIQVKPSDDTNFTPIDLINNIFLGEGVRILNIKYEGDSKSVGYFSNGIGAVNIDRGIIMTTGESSVASLPNSSGGTQTFSSGQKYFDQDLSDAINSSKLYDICKFDITFIPFSDSIRFNYVFASEEYPEFICSQYNDAFGFFIYGANPAGGDYAGKNIALVPGTNEPVSINNVHPYKDPGCQAKNEEYYNTNPVASPTMTYDAYLDVFSAAAKVVPCTEYKIKLVIADVVDDVYDSAVFLEAKSFSTNALKVALNTPSYDATISEGCSSAELFFGFDQVVDSDYDLELRLITDPNLGNIATENIDFSPIPVDAKILKGNSSFSFDMQAYIDNIDEGQELIALEYRKNVCSLDTLFLHIIDNNLATINLEDSILICQDDTVNVGATLPDDYVTPPDKYYYNHNKYIISGDANSQITSTIKVTGFSDQVLSSGILKEICIDTFATRVLSDYDFYIVTPDNRYFELSTDNGFKVNSSVDVDSMLNTCFKPHATVNINNGDPSVGNYFPQNPTYTGDFMPEGNWDDLWGAKIEGDWQLLVVNDEQGWAGQLDSWHIAFNSNYKLFYNWSPNMDISCIDCLSPDIFPDKSRYYYVDYQDTYGCSSKDSIYAQLVENEVVGFLTCDSISVDYIKFKWGANKQGDIYEIRINGKDPWIEVSDTFYEVSGLGFDESVQIEVRVKSVNCENPSLTANCTTYPCPPPDIEISSIKNVTCAGDKNGFIQLAVAGTKPPYSFRYKNLFNNTGYFDNLGKGIDTIYVTDSDSCTIPFIFEISGPDPITNSIDVKSIDCYGANNGSISVSTTGGNGGFRYFWERQSDGATLHGSSLTGLVKSQYILTVTDSENCEAYDTIFIEEPDEINVIASIVDVDCKGYSTGAIFPTVTGGVEEYNYKWSTPAGDISTKNIVNAMAGTYYLTITDQNNCKKDTVFYISEPAYGLNVDISSKDTLCFNEKDAWISLEIPEGKNYQIFWNTGQTRDSIYNLSPGRYSVTVTDSIGCQSIIEEVITGLDSISMQVAITDPSCHDLPNGKAEIENIFYGEKLANIDDFRFKWNTNPPQNSIYAYGLQGGKSYLLNAIDNHGCTAYQNIYVPNPPEIKVSPKLLKGVSCFGGHDGIIELEHDLQDSLIYNWGKNIAGDTFYVDSLAAGIYKVTVTDTKGCQNTKIFSITEPPEIQLAIDVDDVRCKGNSDGQAHINIQGGVYPYLVYLNGEINNTLIDGLSKGRYFIEIVDNNNCMKQDSFLVDEPDEELASTVEFKDVSCFGGSDGELFFRTEGGTPPYSYKVIGGDFYAIDTLIGLKSGKYTAVIRDINGCTDSIANIYINNGQFIKVDLGEDTIVDYDSYLTINSQISGGESPYIYNWIVPEGVEISCEDCPQTELKVQYNFSVRLIVQDSLECLGEGVKNIFVKVKKGIFVPTAFVPAGNRVENRKVFVYGKTGTVIKSFRIFDKWGGKVYERNNFEVNDESEGWDGTFKGIPLEAGAYIWFMEVENVDGTIRNYKGLINLIR